MNMAELLDFPGKVHVLVLVALVQFVVACAC